MKKLSKYPMKILGNFHSILGNMARFSGHQSLYFFTVISTWENDISQKPLHYFSQLNIAIKGEV